MQRKHINQLVIAFDRLFPSQVKILDQSCQIERFRQILAKHIAHVCWSRLKPDLTMARMVKVTLL